MKYSILILSIFIGFCFAKPAAETEAPSPKEGEEIDGGFVFPETEVPPPPAAETEAPSPEEGEEIVGGWVPPPDAETEVPPSPETEAPTPPMEGEEIDGG